MAYSKEIRETKKFLMENGFEVKINQYGYISVYYPNKYPKNITNEEKWELVRKDIEKIISVVKQINPNPNRMYEGIWITSSGNAKGAYYCFQ